MILIEGGWRCDTGYRDRGSRDVRRFRKDGSRHRDAKMEHEHRRRAKRRRKKARALDRRRVKEVEAKYGYYTYHRCTSKRYYPTLEKAMSAATAGEAVFGNEYSVYHCKLCGGYHLTTHRYGDEDETIGDIGAVEIGRAENQGD